MTLQAILDKITHINIEEKRTIADDYSELVFLNKDLEELLRIFTEFFGPPEKQQGAKPSKHILRLTQNYGGIRDNQVFYKKIDADIIIIAMLWPWQDNIHTTLKMAIIK